MILETLTGVTAVLALIWFLWPLLVPQSGAWVRYFDREG